jgi:hypothetical protein
MSDFLRANWRDKNAPRGEEDSQDEDINLCSENVIVLSRSQNANTGPMTLWDVLTGKVTSRIPNMTSKNRPRWSGWDPCSMYRSR